MATDPPFVPGTLQNWEWPPSYVDVVDWRIKTMKKMEAEPAFLASSEEFYRTRPQDFINHWCVTYDPRKANTPGKSAFMPFVMFSRQDDAVELLHQAAKNQVSALYEKSRDMGVTWLCCAFSVWMWRYWKGSSVGWGSRKADLVDKIGDPDSIFEKMRIILDYMPRVLLPKGFSPSLHISYMKIVNPENGSTITGESGDSIGRGGRKSVFFLDEAAHYEHPEKIEAAISNNTSAPIYVSSVNGPTTLFQRKRDTGVLWVRGEPLRRDATNVFIFDSTEHPEKTRDWFETAEKKARDEGLYHLFAQEVLRDASAAVIGTIIDRDHFLASIDAAERLGIQVTGAWGAALDVADGDSKNADRNALAARHGISLEYLSEWSDRDVGVTTRRCVDEVQGVASGRVVIDYDCIGVGAGVKSEVNRLEDEKILARRGLRFAPWNAAASPLDPDGRVVPDDEQSILNKDFYHNLKAQAWWQLRLRFERTWRAVNEPGFTYDPDELISVSSRLPLLRQLEKELTQVTSAKNGSLKLVVNKTPDGQRSPNLADAVVMAYWPSDQGAPMVVSRAAVELSRRGKMAGIAGQVLSPAAMATLEAARGARKTYAGGGMYVSSSRQRSFNDY